MFEELLPAAGSIEQTGPARRIELELHQRVQVDAGARHRRETLTDLDFGKGGRWRQQAGRPDQQGVTTVRICYPDLHGICRGKEFPASFFEHLVDDGRRALRGDHDGRPAPQRGRRLRARLPGHRRPRRRRHARPDPVGSRAVAWCIADLERMDGAPVRRRLARRRSSARSAEYTERGLRPRARPGARVLPVRARPVGRTAGARYVNNDEPRLHGRHASPTRAASSARCCTPAPTSGWAPTRPTMSSAARSTRSTCATRDALDAADRAFLFKTTVKEMAARHGLLATFIGKPWNDDEGSGFHLHLSLARRSGAQPAERPTAPRACRRSPTTSWPASSSTVRR